MRWIVAPIRSDGPMQNEGDILYDRKETIKSFFMHEDNAIVMAKRKAELNPGIPYAVFKIQTVFETTTPNILEKEINSSGELVLRNA